MQHRDYTLVRSFVFWLWPPRLWVLWVKTQFSDYDGIKRVTVGIGPFRYQREYRHLPFYPEITG